MHVIIMKQWINEHMMGYNYMVKSNTVKNDIFLAFMAPSSTGTCQAVVKIISHRVTLISRFVAIFMFHHYVGTSWKQMYINFYNVSNWFLQDGGHVIQDGDHHIIIILFILILPDTINPWMWVYRHDLIS